jgi:hypothetical protein
MPQGGTYRDASIASSQDYSQDTWDQYIYDYNVVQYINGVPHVLQVKNPNYQANLPSAPAAAPTTRTQSPSHAVAGPSSVNSPAPQPPHLQFNFNTIGRPIHAMIGRCRLPGNIIWASGISASGQVQVTSYCTFAASYGAPIDPTEDVSIVRMWANGTLFYDVAVGGFLPPSNLDIASMSALEAAVSLSTVYLGSEGQTADPIIVDDKGADVTPGFRGQRYIVWPLFPLAVAGNSVPNINVEWEPTDGNRLRVADVFVKMGARFGLTVECDGITDLCDGCVVSSDKSLRQFFNQHRAPYNYQIIDRPDGSILLVRRRLQVIGASI